MDIQDQVTSLELSEELLKIGINQESLFCWNYGKVFLKGRILKPNKNKIPAYTAAELGEIVPKRITIKGTEPYDEYLLKIEKSTLVDIRMNEELNYVINYETDIIYPSTIGRYLYKGCYDKNLANAMAKMIIQLKEEGLM